MPEKDDAQKNDDANDNGNTVTVKSLLDSALDGQCLIYVSENLLDLAFLLCSFLFLYFAP